MATSDQIVRSVMPVPMRHVLALVLVAGTTLALSVVDPGWRAPVPLYLFAVIVSTWFGDAKAGVMAAATSVLGFSWLLPMFEPSGAVTAHLLRLIFFALLALFVVWLLSRQKHAIIEMKIIRDELRRSNEALRDSECKLKDAEKLANIGYWERDPVTGHVAWSEEASRIFGRDPPDRSVTSDELLEMIHPDDRQRRSEMLKAALEGKDLYDVEYRIVRPDGEVRTVHVRENTRYSTPVRFGTVQDITERRKADMELRRSERLLREAEALGHTGSWEHNLVTGEILNSEEQLRLFFGEDRGKGARFEDFTEAVHPEDRDYVKARHEKLLAEGGARDIEFRVVWPDGSVRVLSGLATVVRDETGKPIRVYGTNVDITERKRAESALRENQRLLELMLATLPVGVVVTDKAGDVVLSNAASRKVWGAVPIASGSERRAKSEGRWHSTGKKIEPDEWASKRAITLGQTSLNELIDINAYDGTPKVIQNSAAPVRDTEGQIVGCVVVNEDVTERVKAEQALRDSARRLQYLSRRLLEIQEAERRYLALELHDEFGQLLATINLRLHAALRVAGETVRPAIEEAMALLQQAGAQVRNLALELRPAMLETAGLDAALRWLADQIQQRSGVVTTISGHLREVPPEVGIAFFRVVQEALTNVVRHAKARHVRIDLRTDAALEISIQDDGVGFDAGKVTDEALTRGSLGLLGMKERIHVLGGGVEVVSQPGGGTRIRAWVPIDEDAGDGADTVH